jgi:hypothetical protein
MAWRSNGMRRRFNDTSGYDTRRIASEYPHRLPAWRAACGLMTTSTRRPPENLELFAFHRGIMRLLSH